MFSSRPGSTETVDRSDPPQGLDHVVDQHFRRRGAGGDADGLGILQPFRVQFAAVGDQITRDAGFGADFAQPVRVGTIGGAHHQDDVHELAEVPYRRLAVLCRIADIPDVRALNICKTLLKGRDDVLGVVHAQGGLGDVGHRGVRRQRQSRHIVDVLDQQHRAGNLAHGSLDLGMAGMADQDQGPALGHIALALVVDLGDQRAGGIEHRQAARGGLFLDAAGHAMGAEHGDRLRRNFRQILDEDRALVLQAFDHVFVVHDLVAHIDRRAVFLQRALHDLDRAHDARAKAARLRQINFHGTPVTQVAPSSFSVVSMRHARTVRSCNIRTIGFAIADLPQVPCRAKRMEAQDFVSKNDRRGKADRQSVPSHG